MQPLSQLAAEFIAVYVPKDEHKHATTSLAYLLNIAKLEGATEARKPF